MQASSSTGGRTLLRSFLQLSWTPKNFASGRWYPQPERSFSTKSIQIVTTPKGEVVLDRQKAAPIYYKPKTPKNKGYALTKGPKGELLANYPLFEDSINRANVSWNDYNQLTSEERDIYMLHLDAVQKRKMHYLDPKTKLSVFTISHHLNKGECCGNGCRHCPYELENAKEDVRKSRVWNGALYELSKHRTRPPSMGIHRRTRCNVVDNSALGKEAHTSGKLAYCIHVYKQGKRERHMPHATLGDKILVAVRGEMRKAFVVGANTHVHYRKHGVPVTDTNNIVLLDEEGNPLGNRITAPIPTKLLEKKDNVQFNKVLSLANKYI